MPILTTRSCVLAPVLERVRPEGAALPDLGELDRARAWIGRAERALDGAERALALVPAVLAVVGPPTFLAWSPPT